MQQPSSSAGSMKAPDRGRIGCSLMPDRAKRHHQVPRAYLNRLGSDGKVRVRWRDGKAYEISTLNVAVESGFYDVPDPEGGDSSRVEAELAVADGAAAPLFVRRTRRPQGPRVRSPPHVCPAPPAAPPGNPSAPPSWVWFEGRPSPSLEVSGPGGFGLSNAERVGQSCISSLFGQKGTRSICARLSL